MAHGGSPVKSIAPLRHRLQLGVNRMMYGRRDEPVAVLSQLGARLEATAVPGETFNPADRLLLTNIARQAGAVAHAVQLTAALQQSRQQLVTAREEERRRLRRDLHDGLGPQLASQALTIDAIGKLLERNPAAARELLEHLKTQSLGQNVPSNS